MKTLILTTIMILMVSAFSIAEDTQPYLAIVPAIAATAEWVPVYEDDYKTNDIYYAVEEVIKTGITPMEIVTETMDNMDVNPLHLIAALYCADALPEDIRYAVTTYGISDLMLVKGYDLSTTVCGDGEPDMQAYTPVGLHLSGIPSGTGGGGSYGSTSRFVE